MLCRDRVRDGETHRSPSHLHRPVLSSWRRSRLVCRCRLLVSATSPVWRPYSAKSCWTRGTPACVPAPRRPTTATTGVTTAAFTVNLAAKRVTTPTGKVRLAPHRPPTNGPVSLRLGRLARSLSGTRCRTCDGGVPGVSTVQLSIRPVLANTSAREHAELRRRGRLNAARLAALQRRMSELQRQVSEHLRQLGRR
jgi:hypothetical protein